MDRKCKTTLSCKVLFKDGETRRVLESWVEILTVAQLLSKRTSIWFCQQPVNLHKIRFIISLDLYYKMRGYKTSSKFRNIICFN